jgi:hypothetical protein
VLPPAEILSPVEELRPAERFPPARSIDWCCRERERSERKKRELLCCTAEK